MCNNMLPAGLQAVCQVSGNTHNDEDETSQYTPCKQIEAQPDERNAGDVWVDVRDDPIDAGGHPQVATCTQHSTNTHDATFAEAEILPEILEGTASAQGGRMRACMNK